MAHTLNALVYDPATGIVQMAVIPDDDSQLSDPAFNPPGMVHVRVPVRQAEVGGKDGVLGPVAAGDVVSTLVAAVQALTPGLVLVTNVADSASVQGISQPQSLGASAAGA